jgi:DNA-binding CsgD family transcriptional regulator/tetratricopeptide (TPR) repeat protein
VFGRTGNELVRLAPGLADVSGLADAPAGGEPPPPARLFELFLGVLHRLAAEGRLVLVFEDLHWADTSSRDLFGFIARLLRGPVLLVGTYRSDELHRRHPFLPLLSEIRRTAHPEDITLVPLSGAEVGELIAGVMEHPADDLLAAEVHRRSGGNPFYAEELIAHGDPTGTMPETLREVILSRAAPLGDDAFGLMCAIAAAGGMEDVAIVSPAAGLSAEPAEALLPELAASGLLVQDQAGWRFRHELAREVFEGQLLPGERTRVHAALADRLRESHPEQAGRISWHLWRAGDQPRALEWSIKAADAAERVGAVAEAQESYERALDVWDQVPDAAERAACTLADLQLHAAAAAGRAGRHSRAIELTRRAIDELSGDPVAQGKAWRELAPHLWKAGRPGVREAMDRALELIPAAPPSTERASVLAWSGVLHLLEGEAPRAMAVSSEALDMLRVLDDTTAEGRRVEAWALNVLASAAGSLGRYDAADLLRLALDRAREIDDADQVVRAYVNLTHTLGSHGHYDEVLTVAAEGERALADMGAEGQLVTANKLFALFRMGRWDEIETASIELHEAGLPLPVGFFADNLARVLLRRGRMAEAREEFGEHARLLSDSANRHIVGPVTTSLVELAVHDKSWSEARRLVERALPGLLHSFPVDAAELVSAGIAAEAERVDVHADDTGAHEVAERWFDQLQEAVQPFADSAFGAQLNAWLAQAAAERRRLERRSVPDQWIRVADSWEELCRPYEAAYAWLRAAEAILLAAGVTDVDERARATDLLTRARQRADELGARPLAETTATLARHARLQLGASASDGSPAIGDRPFDLTDRELQVLELVAEGKTNGEIGVALFVSRKTASVHVSNILRKLGAANRVEAAAVAHRSGLIS